MPTWLLTVRSRVYGTVGISLSVRPSVRPPVCLSVRPIICPPHTAAAGLLLLARREGDIDRLLHGWAPSSSPALSGELRLVANASSVTFTAAVER